MDTFIFTCICENSTWMHFPALPLAVVGRVQKRYVASTYGWMCEYACNCDCSLYIVFSWKYHVTHCRYAYIEELRYGLYRNIAHIKKCWLWARYLHIFHILHEPTHTDVVPIPTRRYRKTRRYRSRIGTGVASVYESHRYRSCACIGVASV